MHRVLAAAAFALLAACSRAAPPAPAAPAPAAPAPSPSPAPPSPSPAAPTYVAVKGDWGAGTPAQAEVTGRMCALRGSVPFGVVATTGDNFYSPDGVATAANYERPERCLVEWPGHAWRATWGSHDVASGSTDSTLGASDRTYAWSAGGADFLVLDSNRTGDPAQRAWLEERIAASGARVRIVLLHHPPYTAGSVHPNDVGVQRNWVPLFERHRVTLVLAGHNHIYEHSVVNGIHYAVTGGGGAPLYRCARSEPWLVRCVEAHHFLLLELREGSVTVTAIDAAGAELDRFTVEGR